jgi:hypothetical protein
VTLDTAPLDLEALNSPARMASEIKRATQLLSSEQLSAGRRAEAAYFLAMAALDAHKRDSALLLSQMAWRLDGKPMYRQLIQSIRDSIRP